MAKTWLDRKTAINDDFVRDPIFTLLEDTDCNAMITGAAGTGKSTVLREFVRNTNKACVVLAPTGIAATNVSGQTIHSFFQLPPGIIRSEDINKSRFAPIYERMDVLVIDEISMVRRDLFDAMDMILRRYKDGNLPFGGVQLILFGDMYQLPPIVTDDDSAILYQKYENYSNYFFDSAAYKELDLMIVRLSHVYRQSDSTFLGILTRMQKGVLTSEDLDILNKQVQFDGDEGHVVLSTVNRTVEEYNLLHLNELPGQEVSYSSSKAGDVNVKDAPAPERLVLKDGARVIFLVNDSKGRYYNGSLGTVTGLSKDTVNVKLDCNDEIISLAKYDWNIYKYIFEKGGISKEPKGSISQIPLKLAWAMTIHKSQGQTLEKALIDLKFRPWEHGQTYVAFSRLRSLSGLKLKTPLRKEDIKVDSKVTDWENSLTQENTMHSGTLPDNVCVEFPVQSLSHENSIKVIDRLKHEFMNDFGINISVEHTSQGTYRISGASLVADFARKRAELLIKELNNSSHSQKNSNSTIDADRAKNLTNIVHMPSSHAASKLQSEYLRLVRELEPNKKIKFE
ncbi:MAG: DEAD/DEAH box helicase [archaeon]